MKKSENIEFFRNFVACDLKVSRYRQHVELMKCCEYLRSRSFLDVIVSVTARPFKAKVYM